MFHGDIKKILIEKFSIYQYIFLNMFVTFRKASFLESLIFKLT